MPTPGKYWFPAKRYGWGWGLPIAWQGWVAFAAFLILLGAGGFLFPPRQHTIAYVAYVVALSAAFVALCWVRGEPPR